MSDTPFIGHLRVAGPAPLTAVQNFERALLADNAVAGVRSALDALTVARAALRETGDPTFDAALSSSRTVIADAQKGLRAELRHLEDLSDSLC